MTDLEDRLRAHLAARADEVTPSDTLDRIVSDTTIVPLSSRERDRRWWMVAAAGVAVVAGLAIIADADPDAIQPSRLPAPLPAGVPATGVEWTPVGHAALEAANRALQQECMHRAGFDYDSGAETLVLAMGAWQPHPVLGIGTEAAAERYGYRMADPVASGPEQAAAALSDADRERFYAALMGGPETQNVDIALPDGSPSGVGVSWGGCMAETDRAFGGLLSRQEGLRVHIQEFATNSEELVARAAADERVIAALARWRECVTRSAGSSALGEAETPNDLARRYALSGVEVTAAEVDLAVTDARCQTETDLPTTWFRAYAEYQRAALSEHPEWFDLLAEMRGQIVARATEILHERGLDVPRAESPAG